MVMRKVAGVPSFSTTLAVSNSGHLPGADVEVNSRTVPATPMKSCFHPPVSMLTTILIPSSSLQLMTEPEQVARALESCTRR